MIFLHRCIKNGLQYLTRLQALVGECIAWQIATSIAKGQDWDVILNEREIPG